MTAGLENKHLVGRVNHYPSLSDLSVNTFGVVNGASFLYVYRRRDSARLM